MGSVVTPAVIIFLLNSYCSAVEYRLPETVVPTFYDLSLKINPEDADYIGTMIITLHTSNQTKDVYIHSDANYINITAIILNDNAKCYANNLDVDDMVRISCSRALIVDEDNTLDIEFTSKFSVEDGYGLFKSSYVDEGKEQVIIESNFKPTYARRAFPCLDEPDFKASFAVEITHPKAYNVISNSPAILTNKISDDDLTTTKFEDTPEISPYLLDILISQLQEAETLEEDSVDFKIFTRSKVTSLTKTVANTYYHKIIEKLDSYTGVPYQNLNETESYLVALPDYSETMGDFGLFAYRETDLLDEGDKTTARAKQDIIATMAYKLSHEWYGGVVATKWWSDVWANEAVATYLKYLIPDKVDEELELTNQFLLEVSQKTLQHDAYSFAQPLSSKESDINNEWAIENKLSTANYQKGATILRMIRSVLKGEDNLQAALQDHWQNRKEAETDGTDILKDLLYGKSDSGDYYTYLENWVFSPGYPLLTVMLERVDDTVNIANATQKRFVYPTGETTILDNTEWYIPLTSVTLWNHPNQNLVEVFLEPNQEMHYFFGNTWILFNSRTENFYRVNYDEVLWRRILDGLNTNRSDFLVLERAQLIDDMFNIARIGDVSYSLAFEMADSFVNETEYYPWYSALTAFSYLLGKMESRGVESNLKNYILNLMESIIVIPNENFVEASDNHITALKKVMILDWACKLGHADCISYATEKFKNYKESQDSLTDYNARGVIFCNGIRHSENTQQDFNFLYKIYNESSSVHEQNDILNALGCAEYKNTLKRYLEKIIVPKSGIKRQDVLVVFKSVFSSSLGLQAAMDFLEDSLFEIQDLYNDMKITSEMIYLVAENLVTDNHIDWLKHLLNNEILDDYEDVKAKASTLASVNNYWQKNFQGDVADIFPSSETTSETTPQSTSQSSSESTLSTITDTDSSAIDTDTTEVGTTTEPFTTTESKSNRMLISIHMMVLFVIITLN